MGWLEYDACAKAKKLTKRQCVKRGTFFEIAGLSVKELEESAQEGSELRQRRTVKEVESEGIST